MRSFETSYGSFRVRRVSGALGAEVLDVDMRTVDDVSELRRALLDHLVLFFRDQNLSPEDHVKLATKFGTPIRYPMIDTIDGFPEIIPIVKRDDEIINVGGVWHSDSAFFQRPPMGTILCARELPPYGLGDTLFANQYLAYESLSETMQKLLENLNAVNVSTKPIIAADGSSSVPGTELRAIHPVVRTHPETGRKLLYVSNGHTLRIDGMSDYESQPLLDFLFSHQVRPEFTCRFTWDHGSVAFWDNRAAQHNPINDYHGFSRVMHRITLQGDDKPH